MIEACHLLKNTIKTHVLKQKKIIKSFKKTKERVRKKSIDIIKTILAILQKFLKNKYYIYIYVF